MKGRKAVLSWRAPVTLLMMSSALPALAQFSITAVPQHVFPEYPGQINDDGVSMGPPSASIVIAKPGDPAPGTNTVFGYGEDLDNGIFGGYFNAAGQVVFRGFLSGELYGPDQGIWLGSTSSLALIVRGGTNLGLPGEGIAYQVIPWSINAAGNVTYEGVHGAGSAHPSGSESIWVTGPAGVARLVLNTDAPAPGLGPNVKFAFGNSSKIDDRDNVAFIAGLAGPGITEANDESLWVSDAQGHLTLIAREGSPLIADGQSSGIVSVLRFTDYLNDSSALYFKATFTDNTTAEFAVVPEPFSMTVLMLCAALMPRARRR